jgi:hypothetical protein
VPPAAAPAAAPAAGSRLSPPWPCANAVFLSVGMVAQSHTALHHGSCATHSLWRLRVAAARVASRVVHCDCYWAHDRFVASCVSSTVQPNKKNAHE